jgi:crotonobetainyl-CoA:carnitine CoA-transferase CaiB-like acyl-CoA transferase
VASSVKTYRHPQLQARHFFEEVVHPVVGSHLHVTVPFRFRSMDQIHQPWLRMPAPLVGEHNRAILTGILQISPPEIEQLELAGIIGNELTGL